MSFKFNSNDVKKIIRTSLGNVTIFHLPQLSKLGFKNTDRLPYSIKVLLESAIRNCDEYQVTLNDVQRIADWNPKLKSDFEISFKPGRVVLQDFTGVPCVVDLAAMRSALKRRGGDLTKINPQVSCDLVIDHSVQVDAFGSKDSLKINVAKEFERNQERYEFLKWGQQTLKNFRVVPPATGIVHQVNLEYLAKGVLTKKEGKNTIAFPDSLVGTDSHTTMINGMGIVGWGVGGIEAEAVMLGEPVYMLVPEVIGFKLAGGLKEGITATDLVLTITQLLRKKGVVGKFVEFFGPGLQKLTLPDRATIANMAPEYGATIGFFPIDNETLRYYKITGRSPKAVDLVERYMKEQGMFHTPKSPEPQFTDTLELDLSTIVPSLAGPKRPQDRVALVDMKRVFRESLETPVDKRGFGLSKDALGKSASIVNGTTERITHGSVVIAAITSCTNTSNPSVLIGAGILAKKAVEQGLTVKSFIKTSFAPGSKAVVEYLEKAGLMTYLNKLKFNVVGFGCTTCIGNSGPLPDNVSKAIKDADLVAVSILSGNRNFEGRINPLTKANFLASPPLVVAYALAGRADIDLSTESIGKGKDGKDVYLKDIWPTQKDINKIISKVVTSKTFRESYKNVLKGDKNWSLIKSTKSDIYSWDSKSTYIQEPPFFIDMKEKPEPIQEIQDARVLVMVGDSVTTDHISPAGHIAASSPAGQYLISEGVAVEDFNSYGARRGNHHVMARGTFANIHLRNFLAQGKEGWWTIYFPENKLMAIYDASQLYQKNHTPLLVIAGQEYGTGSSRDWAAKGTTLLGVKAVIAQSYERIHRSNLVGMGVLPLEFKEGQSGKTVGLKGDEVFTVMGLSDQLKPRQDLTVIAKSQTGEEKNFIVTVRIDTPIEVDYYRNGGILPFVLRKLART